MGIDHDFPIQATGASMDLGLDGKTHFTLIVSDLDKSQTWYKSVFGFQQFRSVTAPDICIDGEAGNEDGFDFRILFHLQAGVFLGLACPRQGAPAAFSSMNCGMQHFGLHVRTRKHLDDWILRLDDMGISHSGICEEGPGELVRFLDPDKIPVEVYWANLELGKAMFVETARDGAQASAARRKATRA